jgi:hypothetical protein
MRYGVFAIGLVWCANAQSQEIGPKAKQLRQQYDTCVFESVGSQVASSRAKVSAAVAVEMAFQACATEEQAMFALAYSSGASAIEANQLMSNIKVYLKQSIRAILLKPDEHLKQQTNPGGCKGSYKRYDGATVYIDCP